MDEHAEALISRLEDNKNRAEIPDWTIRMASLVGLMAIGRMPIEKPEHVQFILEEMFVQMPPALSYVAAEAVSEANAAVQEDDAIMRAKDIL